MLTAVIILAMAGVSFLFYHFDIVEGTFVPDGGTSDCEPGWFTPVNPDTEEPYTSKDVLREDVVQQTDLNQSEVDQYMENVELRDTENGTVLQKEEVCA